MVSFYRLYNAKIAGSITHIYQGDIKYLCIYAELIVELYNYFENADELSPDEIRGCIYCVHV